MTDTTDTKALRTLSMQRVKEIANGDSMLMGERVDLANTAIRFHKELDVALDAFKNAATELFSAQEQLEAERQRADEGTKEITYWCNLNARKNEQMGALEAEISAMKAKLANPVVLPEGLHPQTAKLVINFAAALAEKLHKAEQKYGYSDTWMRDHWQIKCLNDFNHHVSKGDPRDVAAYCAFMWYHGWSTAVREE